MEPQPTNNLCPYHPSEKKEFICQICRKVLCKICYQKDKSHKTKITPISDKLIDMFEIEEYLGAGAHGCVLKVTYLTDGLSYALKMVNDVNTKHDLEMAAQETKLHAKMTHPNIIKYNSSFRVVEEDLFIVLLELADSSLDSELKSLSQEAAFSFSFKLLKLFDTSTKIWS